MANLPPLIAYQKACRDLVYAFLEKYYSGQWEEEADILGGGLVAKMDPKNDDFESVLMIQDRYFSFRFIKECLSVNPSLSDIYSYQDFKKECSSQYKRSVVSLEEWIKYPEKRPKLEDCEDTETGLLYKCIPALEGITHYEELLEEVKGRCYNHF